MNQQAAGRMRSPWYWVNTTFFMEGFPGIIIMVVTSIMYKNLGISNEQITLYTGMLSFPWVIKPIWASLVDIFQTKKWWIYFMEMTAGIGFVAMAFSLQTPHFFPVSLAFCWVIAFVCSSHDIACDGYYILELKPEEQAKFLGFQSASYQIGKILAQGILVMIAGFLFSKVHDYFKAWTIVMIIAGVITFGVGLYHRFILPKDQHIIRDTKQRTPVSEFFNVYKEFFLLKGVWVAILFLIFYKIGETLLATILPLFLLDTVANGGLDLGNQFTGLAYGTAAPLAILVAGLLGGYCIYKKGFRFWIWWMILIMNVPHIFYILLATFQIRDPVIVLGCIIIEQFCFAFGYSAYTIFLMYSVRNSRYKTAHYSFFSGIMLLGMMIPRMISGWLQELLGYEHFFIVVLLFVIPSILVVMLTNVDPGYGKKGSH